MALQQPLEWIGRIQKMATSKQNDRERRRNKPKTEGCAKALLSPRTFKFLVLIGRTLTFLVWVYNVIMGHLRE
jgi:hypothetical protein